ncbi:hypothetical protein ASPACDRAFT_1885397 [Aspergillus aculeatus ATCC 16872]|uniref:Helix-turn-helix domain-containing protein n=1 Tax=Aspergillus aculeatus (strain ATCC 16872 / CBS 172.66 / WB 5094) TaxID=690307 RepID=A0A1L9X6I0_ASPA1|nr:uncharacterized protein ASPACDRAFT_1885397 [Aspergillus aculeatus ATCC 16872]OJK03924.1 hypothetical protein ASPACDRAFT_1885397 [Aspergillus aculeatus ATCC 16872]
MGASASKPVKSAAAAASRRQYPKQPTTSTSRPPTSTPASAPRAPQPQPQPQPRLHEQPQRSPRPSPQPSSSRPATYYPKNQEQASLEKSSAIDIDGRDPDFAASLRSIGPVTPNPTFSPSSTFNPAQRSFGGPGAPTTAFAPAPNPALLTVTARQRITQAAEEEVDNLGRPDFVGREYLDALTIRQVLAMRDRQGLPAREIERVMRLKSGVVKRLGAKGVVGDLG